VLFLTDGLPTVGERNEVKIVANASEHNKLRARILSFGVGYDVNSRLLDRLVHENAGLSQYVRPDEDLEQHVSTFYSRISAPVMTDVQVMLDVEGSATEEGKVVNRVYPARVNDLFAGEQLVLVGRYRRDGQAKVVIRGRVGSEEQSFDFPATLVAHSADQSDAFVEKLWAIRRIGEIIDELDLRGKNEELIQELVALSTKHGILTPYTSFLADEVQRGDLADARRLYFEAEGRVNRLNEAAGRAAFAQRAEKQMFRQTDSLAGGAIATAPAAGPDGRGGLPPGGAGSAGTPGVRFRDIESDKEVVVNTVLQVGNETLYKQGQRWIAANARDVDVEKQKAEVTVIERFSDEYFALVAVNTTAENAVLAAQGEQEELLIRLRGKAYLLK
jgi:Ca-activated chloride channel family protein